MTGKLDALARDILKRARNQTRFILAISGPPGSGKSTLADALCARLDMLEPGVAAVMPMDGYHFDNAVLDLHGLCARKGAPNTFDVARLAKDLSRIRAGGEDVAVPVFDRGLDLARAGARIIEAAQRIVVVEGNYLSLNQQPWAALDVYFDRTVLVEVPEPELRRRLVARWMAHGLAPDAAEERAQSNDLVNARLVLTASRKPDVVWREDAPLF